MADVKKLFRLVIHADKAQFLSPYEKKAETDLYKKHLEAYETREYEKGNGEFEFVIETFDGDVLKRYRDLARDDKNIVKAQIRIRVFKPGKM